MVVLVPSVDPYDQPVGRCAHWDLQRTPPLGAWKWVKAVGGGGAAEDVPELPPAAEQQPEPPDVLFDRQVYHQRLLQDDWTFEETQYLMEMCERFERRFVVVADRYDFEGGPKRGAAAIVNRYYDVAHRLEIPNVPNEKGRNSPPLIKLQNKDDEQQLLRVAKHVQERLPEVWRRRQEMIAAMAGESFVMNCPSLPDIVGTGGADADEEGGTNATAAPEDDHNRGTAAANKRSRDRKKIRRAVPPDSDKQAAAKRPMAAPVLRTAMLKPVRAGLARQVDKALLELGLPVRPCYPSERNCDIYDKIRSLLADFIDQRKSFK